VVVLPSVNLDSVFSYCVYVFVSGRSHRRGDIIINSRSPLCLFIFYLVLYPFQNVGEITQGRSNYVNSHSPLSEPDLLEFCFSICYMSGRFTGYQFSYSRSPSCVFVNYAFLCILALLHFPHSDIYRMVGQGHDPYTMYIYSLRHFLTTKGALINGVRSPPSPPLKWVKNHSKMTTFSLKFDTKMSQKT